MAKQVLVIESDSGFAGELSEGLEAAGFAARITGDGKEGLELAKDDAPDAIVLCVELPKMSGYSICNKLKKDDVLKGVPLIITSAEATPETFEQHKKLKTRAEEYLIKPFSAQALIDKLGALIGLPEGSRVEEVGEEEVMAIDDETAALDALGDDPEPEERTSIHTLPKNDGDDDDLNLLDSAFEQITEDDKPAEADSEDIAFEEVADDQIEEQAVPEEEVSAAVESLVEEVDEAPARKALQSIDEEADAALDALGGDEDSDLPSAPGEVSGLHNVSEYMARVAELEERLAQKTTEAEQLRATSGGGGGGKEALSLKANINQKDKELLRLKQDLHEKETQLLELKEKETELETQAQHGQQELQKRDQEMKVMKGKMEGLSTAAKKLENELKQAREEVKKVNEKLGISEREVNGLRKEQAELESQLAEKNELYAETSGRAEALEKELETLRTDLSEATDKATELSRKISELENANAKNEERVLKAYQKIKGDEKLREKTKKAISIALQLLEENAADVDKDART
jgi:DNA-binding response OmpR family regulator